MGKPVVAIVGRPNVGKSSLFNTIYGDRISIVHDTPGVTRDRIYAETSWCGRDFIMIDTGGIEPDTGDDIILQQMRIQAEIAIETADVILFMCDLKSGLTASDEEIAVMLRRAGRPVVVCVNKSDYVGEPPAEFYEFYNLGIEDVCAISAAHKLGLGEMLDMVVSKFPPADENEGKGDTIRVAIIGRPNAGKSSLSNRLAGAERSIVSNIAGTTRDTIDSLIENEYGSFTIVDTAGMRKKGKIEDVIERYSMVRAVAAVDRADVCVILVDAEAGITEQDARIAGMAHDSGKASVIVINKWDLIDKQTGTLEEMTKIVKQRLPFMDYAPVLFISAKTGQRVDKLFALIRTVYDNSQKRLTTSVLNRMISEAVTQVPTPQDKGRHLRIYYGTQVSVQPPTFVLFVNDKELSHFSYERYLENQLRRNFGFEGVPLRLLLRNKNGEEE